MIRLRRPPMSAPRPVPGPPWVENPWRPVPATLTDDLGEDWPPASIDPDDPEFAETARHFARLGLVP